MASAIDTATAEPAAAPTASSIAAPPAKAPLGAVVDDAAVEPAPRPAPPAERGRNAAGRPRRAGWRWPISPLTRRILAVNVLALALLAGGFLYLGKYQASLVGQQMEALKTQGQVFAAALGEGAVLYSADEGEILLPDLARDMMRRLVEPTRTRARLFDVRGEVIADSRVLRGPGDSIQVLELPAPKKTGPITRLTDRVYDWIVNELPRRTRYPVYREGISQHADDYPEAVSPLMTSTAVGSKDIAAFTVVGCQSVMCSTWPH